MSSFRTAVFFSPQRSGHNAIVKWYLYQHGAVDAFKEWDVMNLTPVFDGCDDSTGLFYGPAREAKCWVVKYDNYIAVVNDTEGDVPEGVDYHYTPTPNCTLWAWNVVDEPIQEAEDRLKHCKDLKKHSVRFVVARDYRNYIASHIKHYEINGGAIPLEERIRPDIFKEYGKLVLEETAPYFPIFFDKWFSCPQYRKRMANKPGFYFTDIGLNSVPTFGGGSSFDLQRFDGKAQEMDVLNRYQQYEDHPVYKQYMEDKEAVELNNSLLEKYR